MDSPRHNVTVGFFIGIVNDKGVLITELERIRLRRKKTSVFQYYHF